MPYTRQQLEAAITHYLPVSYPGAFSRAMAEDDLMVAVGDAARAAFFVNVGNPAHDSVLREADNDLDVLGHFDFVDEE
jgi:hypothetical protein